MKILSTTNKKVVCITGTLFSGHNDVPRKSLVRAGFERPNWFTTDRKLNDASYYRISQGTYKLALMEDKVFVHTHYAGSDIGIMVHDLNTALQNSEKGVVIVSPGEIAAQIAVNVPSAKIFTLKSDAMELSTHLENAKKSGQLHRIDIKSDEPSEWHKAMEYILKTIN
jgi:hypothetical protein